MARIACLVSSFSCLVPLCYIESTDTCYCILFIEVMLFTCIWDPATYCLDHVRAVRWECRCSMFRAACLSAYNILLIYGLVSGRLARPFRSIERALPKAHSYVSVAVLKMTGLESTCTSRRLLCGEQATDVAARYGISILGSLDPICLPTVQRNPPSCS